MAETIIDANGWPSEPDKGAAGRKPFRPGKRSGERRRLDNKAPEEPEKALEPEKVVTVPETPEAELTPEEDLTAFTQRMQIIRRQLEIKTAENAFMEALDMAIEAEKELGKMLYAIEDTKKHALTAADYLYGDDADFNSIIDSANIAKANAAELPNALLEIAGDRGRHLSEVVNRVTIGRGLVEFLDRNEISGSFGDETLDKIDELRELIEENKQNDAKFTAQTPYDVDREDYESAMNENGIVRDDEQMPEEFEPEF